MLALLCRVWSVPKPKPRGKFDWNLMAEEVLKYLHKRYGDTYKVCSRGVVKSDFSEVADDCPLPALSLYVCVCPCFIPSIVCLPAFLRAGTLLRGGCAGHLFWQPDWVGDGAKE
jgi:hypothetical protein